MMMKKTIFKLMPVVGLCAAMSLASCSDDKGNYTYSDANIITIENIPALTSVLANAEYVDLKPVVHRLSTVMLRLTIPTIRLPTCARTLTASG